MALTIPYDTRLLLVGGLLLLGVACLLLAWALRRHESRYYSYQPLEPEEDEDED